MYITSVSRDHEASYELHLLFYVRRFFEYPFHFLIIRSEDVSPKLLIV